MPARDHEYVVRAEDAAGQPVRPEQPRELVVPDTENPEPPANLAATAADGGPVLLDWQAATDNVAVAEYEVYRDDQLIETIGPATSYSDAVGAGSYSYYLRALDPSGNRSDPSGPATITVIPVDTEDPGPPANLRATASATQVALEWDAAMDNRAVTGYEIHRDGGLIATVGAVTSWSDTNVSAPLTYEYDVRALDAAGNVSDPSDPASATVPDTEKPSPPANLTATATSSQVDLAWDAVKRQRGGHRLQDLPRRRADRDARRGHVVQRTPASRRPGYDYEVRAFDAAGNLSDPSNRPPPLCPTRRSPRCPAACRNRRRPEPGRPHLAGIQRQHRRHRLRRSTVTARRSRPPGR